MAGQNEFQEGDEIKDATQNKWSVREEEISLYKTI